jgi:uncharacterized protein YccT (UPF0319 family)
LATLFVCSSLSALSSQVLAATFNVSDNLIVSEVNDISVDHGYIDNKYSFELKRGMHALIVRYKDVFEDLDFAEDRLVESQDFVVKFTITDQKQLRLSTRKINNLAEAEFFAKSPQLTLQDSNADQLNILLEKVDDYKLAKQVDIAVSALSPKSKTQLKLQPQIQTKVSQIKTMPVLETNKTTNTSTQVNALTMLKYWWNNASAIEKQRFNKFSNEN